MALSVVGVRWLAPRGRCQSEIWRLAAVIPPQKQMTGRLGQPVAENPIDRMFDAVYAHLVLLWQFWKNDIASEADLALAVQTLMPLLDAVEEGRGKWR